MNDRLRIQIFEKWLLYNPSISLYMWYRIGEIRREIKKKEREREREQCHIEASS